MPMARNKYDIDETLESAFDAHSLRRMLGYVRPHAKAGLVAVALMVVASLLGVMVPYLIKIAIDDAIPAKDMAMIAILAGILLAGQLVNAVCTKYRIRIMSVIGQDVIQSIRSDIFTRLQALPFPFFDSRPHGKILIRVVNYVNSLSDLLSNGLIQLITDLVSLIFIIGFMFFIDYRLTLICLAALPPLLLFVFLVKNRQRVAWQAMSAKQSNLNAYLNESLSGVKVTQSFARERENEGIFGRLSEAWRGTWLRAVGILFSLWPVIEVTSVAGVCVVYYTGIVTFGGTVTLGVLTAFVGYIWRFWQPIINIGNFYNNLVVAAAYLERIFETIDEEEGTPDREGAADIGTVRGDVAFEGVSFAYEAGRPVLHGIAFGAEAGKTVAIVGPTGAGKTTIVNLLSRFYVPDSGRILVDGKDIAGVKQRSLRSRVGVMLQDPFLFSGTIMDNIRYGRLDARDEEVVEAAKAVHAHGFIAGLKEGYATQVNERGSRLSMGQRQLIAFARALLADPAILVLDEATSSVDTETERAVQEGLRTLLRQRTSFIIAHRISTIRNADMILLIEKGRIMESGTHEELARARGAYWSLYAGSAEGD
jgi:ATP-binding cassette, subfamily B, multidrug efflux pump